MLRVLHIYQNVNVTIHARPREVLKQHAFFFENLPALQAYNELQPVTPSQGLILAALWLFQTRLIDVDALAIGATFLSSSSSSFTCCLRAI